MLDQVITNGYVTISDLETLYHFGTRHDGCNNVKIKVVNDDFWIRMLMCVPFFYKFSL
jgi:cyclopropane-fatty-acyl-phospholipid synthase